MPKADFSGEWRFNRDKSRLQASGLSSLDEALLGIEHRDAVFKARRTFVLDGRRHEFAFELTCDAGEVARREGGRSLIMTLSWDGDDALVFSTHIASDGAQGSNVVRYRLLEDGKVLEADERFEDSTTRYHNVWIFDRVGGDQCRT